MAREAECLAADLLIELRAGLDPQAAEGRWLEVMHLVPEPLRSEALNELLGEIKVELEARLVDDVQTWDREGRPAGKVKKLWDRELRLTALMTEAHNQLRIALKAAAEAKRLADARARGIPVVKARADVNAFTERRLRFDELLTRVPLRRRVRGARRQRPGPVRNRGSRRCLSRSYSRTGDGGSDPPEGEDRPEGGRLADRVARRRR